MLAHGNLPFKRIRASRRKRLQGLIPAETATRGLPTIKRLEYAQKCDSIETLIVAVPPAPWDVFAFCRKANELSHCLNR